MTDIQTAITMQGFDVWIAGYAKCSKVAGYPKSDTDYISYLKNNYLKAFNKDSYKAIVALNEAGEVVGIAGLVIEVITHLFTKVSVLETFFVLDEYRGVGAKLLAKAKRLARDSGCDVMSLSAPVGSKLSKQYRKIANPIYEQFVLDLNKNRKSEV